MDAPGGRRFKVQLSSTQTVAELRSEIERELRYSSVALKQHGEQLEDDSQPLANLPTDGVSPAFHGSSDMPLSRHHL